MPYVPPVTEKGLKDRIESFIKENNPTLLGHIKKDIKVSKVFDLAINLSFVFMGGKTSNTEKGSIKP